MPEFHRHPEGQIFIRTDAGTYSETRANFEADFGQPLEELPAGAVEHIYRPGVVNTYMADGNVVGGGPRTGWQYGDDAIAAYDQLIAKQNARKSLSADLDMGKTTKDLLTTTGEL